MGSKPEKDADESGETDDRSAEAKAYDKVWLVISGSVAAILPAIIGYWLDGKFGTKMLFTLVGFGFCLACGTWLIYKLANQNK